MVTMLVLADDLTGALEMGAKFAAEGIRSVVSTELNLSTPDVDPETQVLVIDTESRHLSPSQARKTVFTLAREANERKIKYLYKKTDSTLRGNIGAELEGLFAGTGDRQILYAPAYPELGRTVENGRLYVNGIPVNETEFGSDSLNPVTNSYVSDVLSTQTRLPVYSASKPDEIRTRSEAIYAFDGVTETDILEVAKLFLEGAGDRLAAGPAGFARWIARVADWPRQVPVPHPRLEGCLIINGSRREVAARQIEYALSSGCQSIPPSVPNSAETSWTVLIGETEEMRAPLEVARNTGLRVAGILCDAAPEALFIIGGDTAWAIIEALGSPLIYPICEPVPGVPLSRILLQGKKTRLLYLLSKAGGFGSAEIIPQLRDIFSAVNSENIRMRGEHRGTP